MVEQHGTGSKLNLTQLWYESQSLKLKATLFVLFVNVVITMFNCLVILKSRWLTHICLWYWFSDCLIVIQRYYEFYIYTCAVYASHLIAHIFPVLFIICYLLSITHFTSSYIRLCACILFFILFCCCYFLSLRLSSYCLIYKHYQSFLVILELNYTYTVIVKYSYS